MSAPTLGQLEAALTQAYIQQGFVKRTLDSQTGELVPVVPPQLPDYKAKDVKAQAQALAVVWTTWQAAQTVTIPVTSTPGSPSVGQLAP